jgi:branched-chain amino acid transport system permease protein
MFYREAGDFKTSYVDDNQTFPIKFDRYRYYAVLFVAFAIIPFVINDYWVNAVFMPFLIYSIAAIGLNILIGYCGQVSLGTGGFMAVGAVLRGGWMRRLPHRMSRTGCPKGCRWGLPGWVRGGPA